MPRWTGKECPLRETCPYQQAYNFKIQTEFCGSSTQVPAGPIFCPQRPIPDDNDPIFFATVDWSDDEVCLSYIRRYAHQAIRRCNVWPEMWPIFMCLISDSRKDVEDGMAAAGISLAAFRQRVDDPNVLIPWLREHLKMGYPPAVQFRWGELLSK